MMNCASDVERGRSQIDHTIGISPSYFYVATDKHLGCAISVIILNIRIINRDSRIAYEFSVIENLKISKLTAPCVNIKMNFRKIVSIITRLIKQVSFSFTDELCVIFSPKTQFYGASENFDSTFGLMATIDFNVVKILRNPFNDY